MKTSLHVSFLALGLAGIFLAQMVNAASPATPPAAVDTAPGKAIQAAGQQPPTEAVKKGEPVHVKGEKEFALQVLNAKGAVLVDFYADWCPPCRKLGPVLAEIAKEKENVLTVVKVNVDQNRELAKRYKVNGIPQLVLFKDGQESGTQTGFMPKADLLQWLEPNLK